MFLEDRAHRCFHSFCILIFYNNHELLEKNNRYFHLESFKIKIEKNPKTLEILRRIYNPIKVTNKPIILLAVCNIFFGESIPCWQWHPTPVLLPGKSHGWRSLVGCSPWGREESDTTEQLHFHFSLSCTGGGNGNPLQCSCLENPMDGRAWWAAIYGVTQSRTRLKRLSSSSSSIPCWRTAGAARCRALWKG